LAEGPFSKNKGQNKNSKKHVEKEKKIKKTNQIIKIF